MSTGATVAPPARHVLRARDLIDAHAAFRDPLGNSFRVTQRS
jgi:hypothetical protein